MQPVYIRMTMPPLPTSPAPIRHARKHSLAFQTPFANTDIYKSSFYPQTIRDWNIGIHFQILSFLLLKVQKTLLLNSLLLRSEGCSQYTYEWQCLPSPLPPPQLGMPESTLWRFKPPLLILTFTRAVSTPRLLEIGILEFTFRFSPFCCWRCRRLCC